MRIIEFSIFSCLLFWGLIHYTSQAQEVQKTGASHFYIAGGCSTIWITGNNSSTAPLFPKDSNSAFGGGIDVPQFGISLRTIFAIDTNRLLRLTLGGDYFFISGEQILNEKYFRLIARHSLNIATITSGVEFGIKLPSTNTNIYAGIEGRYSFIENIKFTSSLYYKSFDSTENRSYKTKETTSRLGAALRLGVDGEIFDPFYFNISAAYSALNLFNRDDNRGELLTPQSFDEKKENIVDNFLFSFWLQYRL